MSLVEGKNCLITGATSGIGRSTALALSKMGANIFLIARNADKAEELREEINEISGKAPHVIIGDLPSLKQIKKAAEEGSANVNELKNTMSEVVTLSDKVSKIIKIIDDIAFQTNLLALNAAVEAARAGNTEKVLLL